MGRRKNAQKRILSEIQNQLMLKAKNLGVEHLYSPIRLEDMKLQEARKIMGDLLAERTNLQYERSLTGQTNKESIIKLEKIEAYINKCQRVIDSYERNIERMLGRNVSDPKKTKNALKKFDLTPTISSTR